MIALFSAIAIAGLLYFLIAKRQFDFLALGYMSACFYFIPGFFGYAGHPAALGLEEVPIAKGTYVVMIIVLITILLTAVLSDFLAPHRVAPRVDSKYWQFTTPLLTALALAGCVLALLTIGSKLFTLSKFALLDELNRWFLLWTTAATVAFVSAIAERRYFLASINLALLLLDLYIGFRLEITIAFLAVATMRLGLAGPQRLYRHWKIASGVFVLGLALFFYKYLFVLLKMQAWDLVLSQADNPDLMRAVFFNSEPFVILGVLNEVIRQDFQVGMSHLSANLYLLIPFASELGEQFVGFDKLFQPKLFSSVTTYGIGSNIWAEMYSSGGWPFLLLSAVVYAQILNLGRFLHGRLSLQWQAILGVLLMYWAFYIHRNDLLFQLTLTRRVFLTASLCALLSAVFVLAAGSGSRQRLVARST
jgi:hypothetical protein